MKIPGKSHEFHPSTTGVLGRTGRCCPRRGVPDGGCSTWVWELTPSPALHLALSDPAAFLGNSHITVPAPRTGQTLQLLTQAALRKGFWGWHWHQQSSACPTALQNVPLVAKKKPEASGMVSNLQHLLPSSPAVLLRENLPQLSAFSKRLRKKLIQNQSGVKCP